KKWVRQNKFSTMKWDYGLSDEAVALGIPAESMRDLMWIDFKGLKVRIPVRYGSVLDWEYPGWPIPRGGSSKQRIACFIPKWDNPRFWRVQSNLVL
ncbi:MAG: hypothetical protein P8X74_24060, partial [Reinekea sp.]